MTRSWPLAGRASGAIDTSLKDVLTPFPGVISFAGGLPSPDAFDMAALQTMGHRVLAETDAWQYVETEGYRPLRETMARHMTTLGVKAEPGNVLITTGSQQALDLVSMLFLDPDDRVLTEAPGYLGGLKAFENYEAQMVPVPLQDDGLDVNALNEYAHRCRKDGRPAKLLYTVPTFQNPTGCTLSTAKRHQIIEAAAEYDFYVLEDGAYDRLRYDGEHVPAIKSIDKEERVLYLGSLSKSLVPGIRVGWIVASTGLIERLAQLKQATDLSGNAFGQLFAHRWLSEKGLEPNIDFYRRKRDKAYDALRRHMPSDVRYNRASGGFFFWVETPAHVDTTQLLPIARQHGVTYVPGSAFGGPAHTLRFAFSQVPEGDIDVGVQRLTQVLQKAATPSR